MDQTDSSYFEKWADIALHEHDRITPDQLRRQTILAMKEVARDHRHLAAEMVGELQNRIFNMKPSR